MKRLKGLVRSWRAFMVAALVLASFVYPADKSEAMVSGIDLFIHTTVSAVNTTVVNSGTGTGGAHDYHELDVYSCRDRHVCRSCGYCGI